MYTSNFYLFWFLLVFNFNILMYFSDSVYFFLEKHIFNNSVNVQLEKLLKKKVVWESDYPLTYRVWEYAHKQEPAELSN